MPAALAPLVDDATRREFLIGGAALAALIAGCGGPPAAPAGTGSGAFPRTLPGKEGGTTIPAEPRRVVALGFQRDTDTALALGIAPVAITENAIHPGGIAPWVTSELADPRPELLNTDTGVPFEKVAAARPDLILATDNYELTENIARLRQIAPTLSYLEGPEADSWQQRTEHVGAALGLDERARELVRRVEGQIERTAQAHPQFAGRTFSVSYVSEGQIRTVVGADASLKLLERLGLVHSPRWRSCRRTRRRDAPRSAWRASGSSTRTSC